MSAIIVTWNVKHLVAQCLDALRSPEVLNGLSLETIVVDNASQDGTAEWVRHRPGVELIESGSNLGYGRAANIGLREARGKHLLILNPDTIPMAGSISDLVRFQRARPRAGIVAPRLLNQDGTIQRAAFRFPTLLMHILDIFPPPVWLPGRFRKRLSTSSANGRYSKETNARRPFRIDHPLGACMLISRAAYAQTGGFDPAIFMYSEEIELALRYQAAGWECWQVPSAEVVHLGGQSTSQAPALMQRELWRSRLYLYRKHYPVLSRYALSMLILARQGYDLLKLMLGRLVGQVASHEWRNASAHIKALARIALKK